MLSFNISVVDIILLIALAILLFRMIRTQKYTTEPRRVRSSHEEKKPQEESMENSAFPKISEQIAQTPRQPQEAIVLAFCPQCKIQIPLESKFCLKCGTSIQPKMRAHT